MKTFASAMACAMMVVAVDPADERGAYADMFTLATEFTALAGLGKRRLSAAETAKAHRILCRHSPQKGGCDPEVKRYFPSGVAIIQQVALPPAGMLSLMAVYEPFAPSE
jgi:hypothetical protein